MDDDEIVYTSDPDEREALLDSLFCGVIHSSGGLTIPRKRRKIQHVSATQEPLGIVPSSVMSDGLEGVQAPSSRDPPVRHLGHKVDFQFLATQLEPLDRNTHSSASQDELDVISQKTIAPGMPLRPPVSGDNTTFARSTPLTPLNGRASGTVHDSETYSGSQVSSPERGLVGDITSSVHRDNTHTPGPLFRETTSSPVVSTRHRYSSLPPSSPTRSLHEEGNTPSRAQSHPPHPSQVNSSPTHNAEAGPSRMTTPPADFIDPGSPNGGDATRRYSLRTRQARQLNPYKYDKHMYKRQLRGIPEAIVKLTSPRRKSRHEGHGDWNDDNPIQETQDDEWQAEEGELEDEESQQKANRRRRSSDAQERWISSMFDLGDDSIPPLPLSLGLVNKTKKAVSTPVQPDKGPRTKIYSRFPMKRREDKRNLENKDEQDPRRKSPTQSARSSSSHRLDSESIRRSTSPTLAPTVHSGDHPSDIDFDFNSDDANLDLVYDDIPTVNLFSRENEERSSVDIPSVPLSSDEEEATILPTQRKRVVQVLSSPPVGSSSEEDEEEQEGLDRKHRKALKALNRMMPAVMVNRVLGSKRPPHKSSQPLSSSESETEGPRHVFRRDGEEDGDVVPGQSRIRRPTGAREVVPVLGDSESSDTLSESETEAVRAGVVMSEDEGRSSSSPAALFDDEEAFEHDWIVDYTSGRANDNVLRAKRGEDLIDRMLSRTRTSASTSRSRKRGLKNTVKRQTKTHYSETSGAGSLKRGGLNVTIAPPGESRQSILPFMRYSPAPQSESDGIMTHFDDDIQLLNQFDVENVEDDPQPREPTKLSKGQLKKKRREQLLARQTYVLPSGGRVITSGRRKGGFGGDGVRVDFASKHAKFFQALAPAQTTATHKPVVEEGRPRVTIGQLRKPKGPVVERTLDWGAIENSRQTTLHDYMERDNDDQVEYAYDLGNPHEHASSPHDEDTVWGVKGSAKLLSRDLGIEPLPTGLAFGSNTYIGKQWLHELIATEDIEQIRTPPSFDCFDINLTTAISPSEFSERLEGACTVFCDWLTSVSDNADTMEEVKRHDLFMHALCVHASWQLKNSDEEGTRTLQTSVTYVTRRLTEQIRDSLQASPLTHKSLSIRLFSVIWYMVELSTRSLLIIPKRGGGPNAELEEEWRDCTLLLMRCLLGFGLKRSIHPLQEGDIAMNELSVASRTAQIWICLLHLFSRCSDALPQLLQSQGQPLFWSFIAEALHEGPLANKSDFEASEHIWTILFSLSCLSQVSIHGVSSTNIRLPACWDIVATALSTIRLNYEPEDDKQPETVMMKRDKYVRLVVSRCYLLSSRWHWRLVGAYSMFNRLVEVFKSRKYAGLLDEDSDFPSFLRHSNLQHLKQTRSSDTAYILFLKLVAQAVSDEREHSAGSTATNIRKVLSLTVPLTSVPFHGNAAPTKRELSMLYNRFSALILAVYLEPSMTNVRARIAQARRYISFQSAHPHARQACVRAAMYLSVLLKHIGLPLDEPLSWMAEMTDVLMEEFQGSTKTDAQYRKAVVGLQLLLGSIRVIIESRGLDHDPQIKPHYPDVPLLSGPWIKKVFASRELSNITVTRQMILKLLQAFLDARATVVPSPKRLPLAPIVSDADGNVIESQDEFGQFDLDWDDPELIAVLEQNNQDEPADENVEKDRLVSEIMDMDITSAAYRLIMQQFVDGNLSKNRRELEDFFQDTDGWISCWVRCAAIVVQHHKRDWSYYLGLGPQSWERISDSSQRRRAGLRFMHQLLISDPKSYKSHQNRFFEVFFDALVTPAVSIENEYVCLLLSIDGLRHRMLHGLQIPRTSEESDFYLSVAQYSEERIRILQGIVANLDSIVGMAGQGDNVLEFTSQTWLGFIQSMFSTMKDIYETLNEEEQRGYQTFCGQIMALVKNYPHIYAQHRLAVYISWGLAL